MEYSRDDFHSSVRNRAESAGMQLTKTPMSSSRTLVDVSFHMLFRGREEAYDRISGGVASQVVSGLVMSRTR